MKISPRSSLATTLLAALCTTATLSLSAASYAQIEVGEDGSVKLGNMSVSADGDVAMDGLSTDSEGNVSLGDISVSADGSVVMPGLRVESNGSVSMGSNFDADTLSDSIDDEGDSANVSVLFEFGSPELTATGRNQVEEIADAILYLGSGTRVEIQGHTDSVGSDEDNLALSLARAETVAAELKNEHDLNAYLKVTGKGEAEPIADNEDKVGRQLNRRVTLINLGSE